MCSQPMVLLFLDLYGDSRTARCSGAESSGAWRGGGEKLVNTGIREYLVSMVIFLIPRFMRVYSFWESYFWEDNLLCLF